MNKKMSANKLNTKTKPVSAGGIVKKDLAQRKLIDLTIPEIVPQNDVPRYEADEGPLDPEYLEWMKEQTQAQLSGNKAVFDKFLLKLKKSR